MTTALFDWIAALIAGTLAAGTALPPPTEPVSAPARHGEAPAPAPTGEAGILCRLVVGSEGATRSIVASATARERAFSGRYELVVQSHGGNVTRQRGEFDAAPGQTVGLGTLRLGGSAAAKLDARLDVIWVGGRSTCRSS